MLASYTEQEKKVEQAKHRNQWIKKPWKTIVEHFKNQRQRQLGHSDHTLTISKLLAQFDDLSATNPKPETLQVSSSSTSITPATQAHMKQLLENALMDKMGDEDNSDPEEGMPALRAAMQESDEQKVALLW